MKFRGFGRVLLGFLGLVSATLRAQTFYNGGDSGPSSAEPEEDIVQVVPRYPSAPPKEPALKPLLRLMNPFSYVIYETDSELNFEDGNGVRFVKGQMLILARRDLGVSVGDFVAEMKRGSTLWITGDIRGDVEIVNLDDDKTDAVRLTCLLPGEVQMRVLAPSQTLRLRQGKLAWTSTDLGTFWLDSLFFQDLRDHPKDRFEEKLVYALARGAGVSGRVLTPLHSTDTAIIGQGEPESTLVPLTATALKIGENPQKAMPSELLLDELDARGAKKQPAPKAAPKKKGVVAKKPTVVVPALVAQKAQLDVVKAGAPQRHRSRRRAYSTLQSYQVSLKAKSKKPRPRK